MSRHHAGSLTREKLQSWNKLRLAYPCGFMDELIDHDGALILL
jgi:hypothetical protein